MMASLRPFPLDLVLSGFFCQLHFVFAHVEVLLDGSDWLKRLNTSFLLTRTSHFLASVDFLGENKEKTGGGLSPPEKDRNRNHFVLLSFGVDPLNWTSSIEIGEISCSTTAWRSRGHTLKRLKEGQSNNKEICNQPPLLTMPEWC